MRLKVEEWNATVQARPFSPRLNRFDRGRERESRSVENRLSALEVGDSALAHRLHPLDQIGGREVLRLRAGLLVEH